MLVRFWALPIRGIAADARGAMLVGDPPAFRSSILSAMRSTTLGLRSSLSAEVAGSGGMGGAGDTGGPDGGGGTGGGAGSGGGAGEAPTAARAASEGERPGGGGGGFS